MAVFRPLAMLMKTHEFPAASGDVDENTGSCAPGSTGQEAAVGSNLGENSAQKISSEYVDDKRGVSDISRNASELSTR